MIECFVGLTMIVINCHQKIHYFVSDKLPSSLFFGTQLTMFYDDKISIKIFYMRRAIHLFSQKKCYFCLLANTNTNRNRNKQQQPNCQGFNFPFIRTHVRPWNLWKWEKMLLTLFYKNKTYTLITLDDL